MCLVNKVLEQIKLQRAGQYETCLDTQKGEVKRDDGVSMSHTATDKHALRESAYLETQNAKTKQMLTYRK